MTIPEYLEIILKYGNMYEDFKIMNLAYGDNILNKTKINQ